VRAKRTTILSGCWTSRMNPERI